MKRIIAYIFIVSSALFLIGCATSISPQAQSKYQNFQREDGTSLLYIVRGGAFGGSAVTVFHSINGKNIGELGNGDAHIIVALDPGTYKLHTTGNLGLSGTHYDKEFTIGPNETKIIKYEIFDLHGGNYNITDFNQQDIRGTRLSNFTQFSDPVKVAQRKQEQNSYMIAKNTNTIKAFEKFLANYPASKYSQEIKQLIDTKRETIRNNPQKQKKIIDKALVFLNNKDIDGLLEYADTNEDVMEFTHNHPQIYLLFTGPKELQIGKLLQYKKQGLSDGILSSQIKSLNKPYKKYSLDEIKILMELGLTDSLLTTIIDITTKTSIQKPIKQANAQPVQQNQMIQVQTNSTQQAPQPSQGSAVQDAVMEKAGEVILDQLIKNLF